MVKASLNRQPDKPFAKIVLTVLQEDGSTLFETPWAIDLGGDRYELANIPLVAYSLSFGDCVYAPPGTEEKGERPTFQRVLEKSGNMTIRVVFDPPVVKGNASDAILQGLLALGCGSEGGIGGHVCINIPPSVELGAVCNYLMERDTRWEFADPTYADLFPYAANTGATK